MPDNFFAPPKFSVWFGLKESRGARDRWGTTFQTPIMSWHLFRCGADGVTPNIRLDTVSMESRSSSFSSTDKSHRRARHKFRRRHFLPKPTDTMVNLRSIFVACHGAQILLTQSDGERWSRHTASSIQSWTICLDVQRGFRLELGPVA